MKAKKVSQKGKCKYVPRLKKGYGGSTRRSKIRDTQTHESAGFAPLRVFLPNTLAGPAGFFGFEFPGFDFDEDRFLFFAGDLVLKAHEAESFATLYHDFQHLL